MRQTSMKRILHLIQTSGPGGAEKLVLSLAQNVNDNYTSVVGLLKKGWLCTQLQRQGIQTEIVPSGGRFDLTLVLNLKNLIRKEKIDIIHSHLLDMNFYSSLAARFAGVPHICTEHGDIHHVSKKINLNTYAKIIILSRLSNKIIFVSQFTKDRFLDLAKLNPQKSAVIYNGINQKEYTSTADIKKKKDELGIKEDELIIGNVANLYPVKGHIYLLKAAKTVMKEFPNVKFIIVGKGGLGEELKNKADLFGIRSRVKFLGFREDVKELLTIMDIFTLASLSEGLPLSLIEAMASKVPIIATRVGGIPEVIEDGISGFLVPPADPDRLATAILHLLKNKNLMVSFAEKSYQRFIKQFTEETMISQYLNLYLN